MKVRDFRIRENRCHTPRNRHFRSSRITRRRDKPRCVVCVVLDVRVAETSRRIIWTVQGTEGMRTPGVVYPDWTDNHSTRDDPPTLGTGEGPRWIRNDFLRDWFRRKPQGSTRSDNSLQLLLRSLVRELVGTDFPTLGLSAPSSFVKVQMKNAIVPSSLTDKVRMLRDLNSRETGRLRTDGDCSNRERTLWNNMSVTVDDTDLDTGVFLYWLGIKGHRRLP